MLVFNEGLPRSGKSYDTMKSHILPALLAGRKVYARLNGLDDPVRRAAIAAHLGMDYAALDALLVHVTTPEVRTLFRAEQDSEGSWVIPDELKDCLFVIDECHSFYVASTQPIQPAFEEFFALIGQNGGDGVLMTQFYRRLHSSVRGRIERKNVFQKLTAVGMNGSYTVKRYHATAPERFELVATDTEKYDSAMFPLYKGYADGSENRGVYSAGGQTVWKKLGKYAVFVIPLLLFGVYELTHFFSGNGGMVKTQTTAAPHAASTLQPGTVFSQTVGAGPVRAVAPDPYKGLTVEQTYVAKLSEKGRPRLAGFMHMDGHPDVGLVEWRSGDGPVTDRLSFAELRSMGVTIESHVYGVKLVAGKDSVVVTSWPLAPVQAPSTSDTASSSVPTGSTVQTAGPVAQSALSTGEKWPDRPTAKGYTPPELVPHQELSSYTGR